MKNFICFFLTIFFVLTVNIACAQKTNSEKVPTIKYNGNKYTLYYSVKSKELDGYLNEYYKPREGYTNWTELVALHHYPNSADPIEHSKAFENYIKTVGEQGFLEIDKNKNTGLVDFVMISNKRLPIVIEYNIFRYEKSSLKGIQALQYARRYRVNNALEVDKILQNINKKRKKEINKLKKAEMPVLVERAMDRGKYIIQPKPDEPISAAVQPKEETVTEVSNIQTEDKQTKDEQIENNQTEDVQTNISEETELPSETQKEIISDTKENTIETNTDVSSDTEQNCVQTPTEEIPVSTKNDEYDNDFTYDDYIKDFLGDNNFPITGDAVQDFFGSYNSFENESRITEPASK